MNPERTTCRQGAFTLIEMLCVVAVIAILAALLLPVLNRGQAKARALQCVDNLKQTGLAFHIFAHDHNGRFPMEVPMSEGGSLGFAQNGYLVPGAFYFSYRHFAALSNELDTPRVLTCPADSRWAAWRFASFDNDHLSYFVGVKADFMAPYSILAGDRNITNDHSASPTLIRSTAALPFRWTEELHRFKGNLLFADGHVQEVNEARLSMVGGLALNADLVLPSSNPGPASSSGGGFSTVAATRRGETSAAAGLNPSRPAVPEQKQPSGSAMVVSAKAPVESASVPAMTTAVETNSPPAAVSGVAATSNAPAAVPEVASGGSGFTSLVEELARQFDLPVWLLYLLLLFLLVVIGAMALRIRSR